MCVIRVCVCACVRACVRACEEEERLKEQTGRQREPLQRTYLPTSQGVGVEQEDKLPGTLIILNTSFSISATQATENCPQNYSCRIGQDLLIQLY